MIIIYYPSKLCVKNLHIGRQLLYISPVLSNGNSTINRCHFETKHFCHKIKLDQNYDDFQKVKNDLLIFQKKILTETKKCEFNGKHAHLYSDRQYLFNRNSIFCCSNFEQMKLPVFLKWTLDNPLTNRCRHFSNIYELGNKDSVLLSRTLNNSLNIGCRHFSNVSELDKSDQILLNRTLINVVSTRCRHFLNISELGNRNPILPSQAFNTGNVLANRCRHFSNISGFCYRNSVLLSQTLNNVSATRCRNFSDISHVYNRDPILFSQTLNNVLATRCRHFSDISDIANGNSTVKTDDIEAVLQKYLDKKYDKGYTCYITMCTKLGKKHISMVEEGSKMYINSTTGHFLCNHCKKYGNWTAFEDNAKALSTTRNIKKVYDCHANNPDVKNIGEVPPKVKEMYENAQSLNSLNKEQYEALTSHFGCVGLLKSVMLSYGVRYTKDSGTESLLFPFFNPDQSLVAVKQMSATEDEDENIKIKQKFFPRNGTWQLFGWKKAKDAKGSVVITGNELDAMAVNQATGVVSLSLPKGYSIMPQEILPFLERFDVVTFWLGNDAKSWDATKMFALKVNEKRSHVIRPSVEDCTPLEALQTGLNLKQILETAKPYVHQSIVSFSNLKDEVYSELAMMEQVTGVKWHRYLSLNKLLKGHRRGELTIFTGPTGSGKTTFMSEYSLDLCMQGVSTLWGSFEIQNVRLARVMLMQYSLKNLHNYLHEYDYWSEKFEQLPMHFMTFFGQEDITKVIDTMSHAVYVHDIGHVIVDNLQFMMGMDFNANDRFVRQDRIVAAFRRFATQKNCHVTLIIHPRKEKNDEDLTIASIFGSAKVSQEADNIIILQDKTLTTARGRKFIQVVKNRYSGDRGLVQLKFDSDSLTFSGVSSSDKEKTKGEKVTEGTETHNMETVSTEGQEPHHTDTASTERPEAHNTDTASTEGPEPHNTDTASTERPEAHKTEGLKMHKTEEAGTKINNQTVVSGSSDTINEDENSTDFYDEDS